MFLLPFLKVKPIKNKGRGVFTLKDIPAGMVAADYLGQLVPANSIDEKRYGLYDMFWNNNISIMPDSNVEGAHLINHACIPNCDTTSFKGHTIIFSLRKIFAGEELTYIYNIDPPSLDRCNPCKHSCFCGSDFCRGTFHIPFKEWKLLDSFLSKKEAEYIKTTPVPLGQELPPLNKYPELIKTNPKIYNTVFGYAAKKPLILNQKTLPKFDFIYQKISQTGQRLFLVESNLMIEGILNGYILVKNVK